MEEPWHTYAYLGEVATLPGATQQWRGSGTMNTIETRSNSVWGHFFVHFYVRWAYAVNLSHFWPSDFHYRVRYGSRKCAGNGTWTGYTSMNFFREFPIVVLVPATKLMARGRGARWH